jgi:hypothetical protein
LFRNAVGKIILKASVHPATGKNRPVRIFGEMVSLLYVTSNVAAAQRLEDFWNELVEAYSVSLFCAYSLKANADSLPQALIDSHSHNIDFLERAS